MATAGERAAAAEVLAKAKARTARVRLLLDGPLSDQIEALNAEFGAVGVDSPEAVVLAERLAELAAESEKAKTEFVFKVGRARWRALIADHPPSDEQRAVGADFNPDTFIFAAMAEFLIEPKFSIEDLHALDDELDETQFQTLWGTCLKAAIGGGAPTPSEAARQLLTTRGSSTPASSLESAEAS